MEITNYQKAHEDAIISALSNDPDWQMFIEDGAAEAYRKSLERGISYVCYEGGEFCGYVRAILDAGFFVYVSELYVLPQWRNKHIGRSLLARVKSDYPELTVYVLSDEDDWYHKLGCKKAGSIFEL